jgi:chromate transporter
MTVTPWTIFRVFIGIALSTFGSSQSAAIQRQVVTNLRWLSQEEFLTLRGLALVVPGPNSPSLAMLVGQRLAGTPGALAAYLSAAVPGLIIAVLLGLLAIDPKFRPVGAALQGATAATVGLLVANAFELTQVYRRRPISLVLTAIVVLAVVFAHLSLWLTLAIFLPISIAVLRPRSSG